MHSYFDTNSGRIESKYGKPFSNVRAAAAAASSHYWFDSRSGGNFNPVRSYLNLQVRIHVITKLVHIRLFHEQIYSNTSLYMHDFHISNSWLSRTLAFEIWWYNSGFVLGLTFALFCDSSTVRTDEQNKQNKTKVASKVLPRRRCRQSRIRGGQDSRFFRLSTRTLDTLYHNLFRQVFSFKSSKVKMTVFGCLVQNLRNEKR